MQHTPSTTEITPGVTRLSDPAGGTIVCHNDVEPSNIVFRDGIAVGFIDFEFAAPGRPVYDLAQMARVCVPMDGEVDRARSATDRPTSPRGCGSSLTPTDWIGTAGPSCSRRWMLRSRIEAAIRRSVDAGDPNAKALWDRTGGGERFDRRRRWWAEHHGQFVAALR